MPPHPKDTGLQGVCSPLGAAPPNSEGLVRSASACHVESPLQHAGPRPSLEPMASNVLSGQTCKRVFTKGVKFKKLCYSVWIDILKLSILRA